MAIGTILKLHNGREMQVVGTTKSNYHAAPALRIMSDTGTVATWEQAWVTRMLKTGFAIVLDYAN